MPGKKPHWTTNEEKWPVPGSRTRSRSRTDVGAAATGVGAAANTPLSDSVLLWIYLPVGSSRRAARLRDRDCPP